MTRLTLAAALLSGAIAAPAFADVIVVSDPKTVATTLLDLGFRAALSTDGNGIPMIESAMAGVNFSVFFYGCQDGSNCPWLEMSASFTPATPVTAAVMNDWNANNLFGTGFVGTGGEAYFTFVVLTYGGLTSENFNDIISTWESTVAEYMTHIKF